MRAARYYDQKDIRIDDIDAPEAQSGQVLIDVAWCGICGSDLHEYLEGPLSIPPAGHPHPISGEEAPVTIGHEMSGTVAALGDGVTDLEIGQQVVVEPYVIEEKYKNTANYNLSPNMGFIGLVGRGGGLAEQIAVDRHWVHPISDDVPLDQAAMIEPLSVAHHAYVKSQAQSGDIALIGGAGPIGVLTTAVLKAEGITTIVSEPSDLRRNRAEESGVADYVLDPRNDDVVEEVLKITDGRGVDVGFECSSVPVVLDTLIEAVRPAGTIVNVSVWSSKPEVNMPKLVLKEIKLAGVIGYCNDHKDTIDLVESGKIDLKPFITGKIGLDDLIDKGFDALINHNESAIKILVSPSGQGLDEV
ncbi:2,3-butanediol dehydrogenase [Auritidibacter sp. NML120636]|uniref:2,3-butanediol dehydrogenase n=1 Tax=Auritidibacter sp. NML120636 TaxID=2170743 RepID=UPI000D7365A5|nr:2,3-butanediol dehydrogenase [Auritidibacter sp. NML120636]PXA79426.1 2,3-butanediol dehydrogenase [Auritidibacter sp. NML120636]